MIRIDEMFLAVMVGKTLRKKYDIPTASIKSTWMKEKKCIAAVAAVAVVVDVAAVALRGQFHKQIVLQNY